ncbi:hypothetical protein A8A54_15595 [Brucella pseudogrignonensis]|uniref:hypothetical protein n=1 Tax=Brucella pseudogrignonensis TaxID=419475 RepID=UPI0007DA7874|nr:hypothetical protein [Brucella pseudogrignonensis]ANG97781.1 hypothetical protein A8A54_15595 [Brucella pseudogrignonensis]
MKQIEDHKIPDGLYRMEFTSGERRRLIYSNLHAHVIDGPEAGKFCGEIVFRSCARSGNDIDAAAIRMKTDAYVELFGIKKIGKEISHEEFLFRPFFADIREGRIASISTAIGHTNILPAAGLSEHPTWSCESETFVWSTSKFNRSAA